MDESSKLKADS